MIEDHISYNGESYGAMRVRALGRMHSTERLSNFYNPGLSHAVTICHIISDISLNDIK